MSAREGMSVDEALFCADNSDFAPARFLAAEVRRLRSPAVFDMEAAVNAFGDAFYCDWETGSPSTSWRTCPGLQPEVTPAITKALTDALPHLQPDMEALRRNADRWQHARKLLTVDDIEGAQGAYDSFGRLTSEEECRRADAAMDAALAAQAGKQGGR